MRLGTCGDWLYVKIRDTHAQNLSHTNRESNAYTRYPCDGRIGHLGEHSFAHDDGSVTIWY